jgi:hypothetical protein
MKFSEFLKEASIERFSMDAGQHELSAHCQQFMKASMGFPLYRGIRMPHLPKITDNTEIVFSELPTDRKSVDAGKPFNLFFNSMIELAFGIKDIRKISAFGIGNTETANGFGQLHYMFPKDGYKILYAPRIRDSLDNSVGWFTGLGKYISEHCPGASSVNMNSVQGMRKFFNLLVGVDNPSDEPILDLIRATPADKKIIRDHLAEAAKSWFMLKKETDALSSYDICIGLDPVELHRVICEGLEAIGKDAYCDDNNIAKAIKNDCEIMMYSGDGYYVVPKGEVKDYKQFVTAIKETA